MNFSDLAPFYADFGVSATHTPQAGSPATGKVLFDQPGTTIVGGEILATDYSVRFPAVTFQSVRRGDQVTIGSVNYLAREDAQPASFDGLEMIVPLSRSA